MKIIKEYKTHTYETEYILGELFCPNCGCKGVWEEQGQGDYYCGADYLCVNCDYDFTIQGPQKSSHPEIAKQLFEQLK